MSWSEPRVDVLKKLWADGRSASHIGGELGITRNAVIGKLHRLGLCREQQGPRPARGRPPRPALPVRAKPAGRIMGSFGYKHAVCAAPDLVPKPRPEPEPVEIVPPLGQRCTLLELNDDRCRWPVGDPAEPGFFFCGGKPAEAVPYCAYHARIAYQPAIDRGRIVRGVVS